MTGQRLPASGPIAAWRTFWFQDVPPHSLALLRIALGGLGAISVLTLTPVEGFWSTQGLAPVPGGGLGIRRAIADSGFDLAVAWGLFLASLLAFTAAALGYRTATSVVAAFAASVGMTYWNPLPLNGGHYVSAGLLFLLMWTGSGEVLSVDAWLRRRSGDPGRGRVQPIWPLRLMRFQIAVIYLNSGLGKLYHPAWRDGSALHYVLHLNTFARFPQTLPPEWDWVATAGTYVTLVWEVAFPFLLFQRLTRRLALLLGVLLHLGMALTMEVGLFSWVMLAGYIAFLDPYAVARRFTNYFASPPNRSSNPL